jgi:predicted  nucleic acid-binding Zn-ribbon protein
MAFPELVPLLVYQDRDLKRLSLEKQLAALPHDRSSVQRRIGEEQAELERAKQGWREAEARRKALETEIGLLEQKALRLKAQQLEVRKNEEYQALGREIEGVEAEVSAREEEEIAVLYQIDRTREEVAAAERKTAEAVRLLQDRLKLLDETEVNLRTALTAAQAALAEAQTGLSASVLDTYRRLAQREALPVVVPLEHNQCTGCHLKVSSGVESDVRTAVKLVCCGNCGRILYWAT